MDLTRAKKLLPGRKVLVCIGIQTIGSDPIACSEGFIICLVDVLTVEISSECIPQNISRCVGSKLATKKWFNGWEELSPCKLAFALDAMEVS